MPDGSRRAATQGRWQRPVAAGLGVSLVALLIRTARSKGVDAPVAEVADQHAIAERAEIGRGEGKAPRGVERPT
jgi:hypothetical protein